MRAWANARRSRGLVQGEADWGAVKAEVTFSRRPVTTLRITATLATAPVAGSSPYHDDVRASAAVGPQLTSAIHPKVKSSLIMRLSCGNTPQVASGSPHLLGAGHIKRFRRSSVVHGQDRNESRLIRALGFARRLTHMPRRV